MKNIIFTLLLILTSSNFALAKEKTDSDTTIANSLFSGMLTHSGGYGGVEIKFYPGNDIAVEWAGIKGGWIINRMFSIGGAGYGLFRNRKFPVNNLVSNQTITSVNIGGGYGGLYLEYINSSNSLVHFTGNFLFGVGAIGTYNSRLVWSGIGEEPANWNDGPGCLVFVLEPSFAIDVNILEWMRLSVNAGYRFVPNFDLSYIGTDGITREVVGKNAMNGMSIGCGLKFGKF